MTASDTFEATTSSSADVRALLFTPRRLLWSALRLVLPLAASIVLAVLDPQGLLAVAVSGLNLLLAGWCLGLALYARRLHDSRARSGVRFYAVAAGLFALVALLVALPW